MDIDKNFAAYGAAKAGKDQMTRILAYELAPSIRVNGIAPGPLKPQVPLSLLRTKMCTTPRFAGFPRTAGTTDDIALAALYPASSAAGFVSGKVIEVDGEMAALPGTAIEAKILAEEVKRQRHSQKKNRNY